MEEFLFDVALFSMVFSPYPPNKKIAMNFEESARLDLSLDIFEKSHFFPFSQWPLNMESIQRACQRPRHTRPSAMCDGAVLIMSR